MVNIWVDVEQYIISEYIIRGKLGDFSMKTGTKLNILLVVKF